MTAHPIDTEALLDRLRRNAQAPMDRVERLNGMGGSPEYGDDERPFPDEMLKLLDLLAAAEHRATRAEAQSAIRGRAVVIYRERAREAEAERDWNIRSSRSAKKGRIEANARADRAEAERDGWRQTALDERGAALDALEQIKARDARIKAVQAILDENPAAYARTYNHDIRRALDGDA